MYVVQIRTDGTLKMGGKQRIYLSVFSCIPNSFYKPGQNVRQGGCGKRLLQCSENLKGSSSIMARRARKCRLQSNFAEMVLKLKSNWKNSMKAQIRVGEDVWMEGLCILNQYHFKNVRKVTYVLADMIRCRSDV